MQLERKVVIQIVVSALFAALLVSVFFLLPIAGRMSPGDERRRLFLLFGPVSSLYTHSSIFGLFLGAGSVLACLLGSVHAKQFKVLLSFLAVVLWFIWGALFSLMI